MSSEADEARQRQDVQRARDLREAVTARDEARALRLCRELFEFDPRSLTDLLDDEALQSRRDVHEALDEALRGLLLAADQQGEAWRRLLLPASRGILSLPLWIANAQWLRLSGSSLPDENAELLDAEHLATLDFVDQAKTLGRFCVVNDGARAVNVGDVLAALDDRLAPFFVSWLVGTHSRSPGRLDSDRTGAHQERALDQLLELWRDRSFDLPASPLELEAAYDAAYGERSDLPRLAEMVNGGAIAGLFSRLRTGTCCGAGQLSSLAPGSRVVVAPNWRESHVAYRCLSPLLEGERRRGTTALVVREYGTPQLAPPAQSWSTIEHELPGQTHHLIEVADAADVLASRALEFAFYPEITPSNPSGWLATQRLARVQATGYGYPVTSGLPSMDYFVCGTEIEDAFSAARYVEQVVLVPGLGVSTTPPPQARSVRTRPLDDDRRRIISAAGFRKLNPGLLRAWNTILKSSPRSSLDLFPAMTDQAARRHAPAIARHLDHEQVTLHPSVDRMELLDHLVDADLYLDSFPFGGFNTLVEVLACGCPFVTLERGDARNRFGAALLRRLRMPEFLIAHDWPEYLAAATRVLSDAGLRAELRARLGDREEVLAALTDDDVSAHFDAAVSWMLERGSRNGTRRGAPVRVEAGTAPRALAS